MASHEILELTNFLCMEFDSVQEVEECVRVLKYAAKTRKVPQEEILSAFSVIEKAKLDPSRFLETLGGAKSPGRTWMLVFTAQVIIKLLRTQAVVVLYFTLSYRLTFLLFCVPI